MWSDLTLDPSFKVKRGLPKLVFISCLFVFLEVCSVTPTYRKSWAKNLLTEFFGQNSPWASSSRLSDVRMALVSFLLVDTICIGSPMR